MSLKKQLSVTELNYFRDEIERVCSALTLENKLIQDNFDNIKVENFKTINRIFLELSELAEDLGAEEFKNYFDGFAEITYFCTQVSNPRAHKKVAMMSLDYEKLLLNLVNSFHDLDKLKGIFKAFEVQIFKQERLRRGEFYSLEQNKSASA